MFKFGDVEPEDFMRRVSPFIMLFIFFTPLYLLAQIGVITGSIVDHDTNDPIIAANVVVEGTHIGAATNEQGKFRITRVPVGNQSLRVTVIGYETVVRSDIMINPVKPVVVDFKLKPSVIEFGEITVRPQYFTERSDKLISTQSQSNEEIRRLPGGFEDVVRAISILPGVAQPQSGRNDLIVRGGAPSENLYVIDGLEVPNINHFGTQGASGGPISFINLDFVSSTTFSSGGFGVRYGDRLSSVLSLNLRDGRKDRFGGKGTISASQFGLNLEGPVGNNGSMLFSARRSYLDFIFKANGFGFVPEYWDFMTKINYPLGKNDDLQLLGIAALDRTRFFNDTRENRIDNSTVLGSSQDQAVGGLSWRHLFRGGFSRLVLGQSWVNYHYFQNDSTLTPLFRNHSLEHETLITGNVVYHPVSGTELTGGLQARLVNLDADILLPGSVDDYGYTAALDLNTSDQALKTAGWLQIAQDIRKFEMILGVRYDSFDMIQDKFAFSPRISIRYNVTQLSSVKVSAGRYKQAPSFIWLLTQPENKRLKYINADQLIVGMEHLIRDDTIISLEGYYKKYSDYPASETRKYLVMANTGAGYGGAEEGYASFGIDPLVSRGSGWAQGGELFLQKKYSEVPLYGTLSLSYNRSRFKGLDGIERPGSYDQRWIFNIGGGYAPDRNWEISSRIRYASGRPYTPLESDLSRQAQKYNSERVKNNFTIDVRIDRHWYLDKYTIITYIDIQNLLNRKVYDVPKYDPYEKKPDQTAGIGILPSIGLSVEI